MLVTELFVMSTSDVDAIRTEKHEGVDHIVVPLVALVEGVVWSGNSPVPELALANEFGKIPEGWNGRPVTLGHPRRNGQYVSASQTPKIFEEETLGFLFNTRLDDKKLKTEAWINMDKVASANEEVQKEIKRLQSGETVEISTGLFAVRQEGVGRYNGEDYNGIWSNVVPDHLAILKEGEIGACSVEDGCGAPRLNFRFRTNVNKCKCEGSCDPCKNKVATQEQSDKKQEATELFSVFSENISRLGWEFQFNGNAELSDSDRREALVAALAGEDENAWFGVIAVFSESLVYCNWFDGKLLKRDYKIHEDGTIVLGSNKVQVRPVTDFVPIVVKTETREDKTMSVAKKVAALIANKSTKFSEDDRSWLETLSEENLDKLAPNDTEVQDPDAENPGNTETEEEGEGTDEVVVDPTVNSIKSPEQFIAQAPEEMREMLTNGLQMHRKEIDAAVKSLLANSRNPYTEKELRAMKLAELQKLNKLAGKQDFRGQAGGKDLTVITNEDDNKIPAPLKVFETKVRGA